MFDIKDFEDVIDAANEGLPFEPRHPATDEPFGSIWTVASYNSKAYRVAERAARNKGMKAVRTNKLSASDIDANEILLLSSLVLSWDDKMVDDGKPYPCTPANVQKLLSHAVIGPSLRKQLDEHAENDAAFFEASGKPSPMPSDTK